MLFQATLISGKEFEWKVQYKTVHEENYKVLHYHDNIADLPSTVGNVPLQFTVSATV